MGFITLIKQYVWVGTLILGAIATWWVTSAYYDKRIAQEREQAENAVIDQCNERIDGYEKRITTLTKDFVAIGKRYDAMSDRVLAECKPLGLPGHTDSTTRYRFYGSDGLFLSKFAKYCAENLAVCKR